MAHTKIVEFPPMARPKICRTAQEAAAVPLHLPIRVELPWPPAPWPPGEKMYEALEKVDQAKKATIRAIETELSLAKKRVKQLKLELLIASVA
jgi:hypothetical protein